MSFVSKPNGVTRTANFGAAFSYLREQSNPFHGQDAQFRGRPSHVLGHLEGRFIKVLRYCFRFPSIMEDRAAIKPELPCLNPTASSWQDPPSKLASFRSSTSLPETVDVVVVGSGITGATVAHELLKRDPDSSVLMLEARTACSGATGRNGGHTKPAGYRDFLDNRKSIGSTEAAKIVKLQYQCMRAVHQFARKHDISCDSVEGDTVDVFYDENKWLKARHAVTCMKKSLATDDAVTSYRFYDATETEQMYRTPGAFGSLTYHAGSLNAYRFVIGLLKLAIQKGLNLQTGTPVLRIEQNCADDHTWVIYTPRGKVLSQKIVLATNGYTARVLPQLQGVLVPLRGTMTTQRPGTVMPEGGLSSTYSFVYEDGYEYMVPRPQTSRFPGDIMIGGGLVS